MFTNNGDELRVISLSAEKNSNQWALLTQAEIKESYGVGQINTKTVAMPQHMIT